MWDSRCVNKVDKGNPFTMYMHIKYHTVHFTYPTVLYVNFSLMSEVKVAQ